ncbi:MAG: heme exporter protein CcmB [Gammaproteobacteria bacterium]|nr:heme exporter protein CcmB [Gammaproteobacteria bacterium]
MTAPPSLFAALAAVLRRDLIAAGRRRGELLRPLFFFVITLSLFPLAANPDPDYLQSIAPAVIWVAALLATLLGLDRVFRGDFADGALQQLLLSPHPPSLLALAKILAHWLLCGAPLALLAPLPALMLHLPPHALPALVGGLLLGTALMSLLGAAGAALTLGARGGGMLLALLVLPLYIPALIFGAFAARAAALGLPADGPLLWLGAMLLLALALAPAATAAGLRASSQ